jgi:hypothetical protein
MLIRLYQLNSSKASLNIQKSLDFLAIFAIMTPSNPALIGLNIKN